jgi:2-polyprenyl-3-methyl-5-hydroxy-6-metoxy-1,4-benzoquinol methylase
VVRCRVCGFGQPEQLPAIEEFFDTLYHVDWSPEVLDSEFNNVFRDHIYRTIIAGLSRRLPAEAPRTLLDVGTSVGRFVHLARQAGWEVQGTELDPVLSEYAARRTGATIHHRRAEDLADEGFRFSAVALNDVLEHIPRPAPLLSGLRRLLAPGGVLAVKVPHGPAQRFKEGIRRGILRSDAAGVMVRYVHVNHFTAKSLRTALERAGFRDVAVGVAAPEYLPASWPGRTRAQAATAAVREAVYRVARLVPGGVHTPLALNLQAYAVNPGGPGA